MIVGMDFGTTNSSMAVFTDQVRFIPIDASNPTAPHVVRSTLYISRRHEHFIGRRAIDEYYERNQGRPVKLRQEYVGTIELTFAELGTYYRDVFVWVDELEPGRLFRSIKTHLGDEDFMGTSVWGRFYSMEDLVSMFLFLSKRQAEQELGAPISEIVLGRPVHFADTPEADRLAEERLARAAVLAGYERVHILPEPIAAAFHYQQELTDPQKVLVFDFGGGTLDITVMEMDGQGRHQVLSTSGERIAGDTFDQKIVLTKLAPHFGSRLTYGRKALRMPRHIFQEMCDWQTLGLLNRQETLHYLTDVERTTAHPEQIRALRSLIVNNYGLKMFDEVEKTKITLSARKRASLALFARDILINERLERIEFEGIIATEATRISNCIDEALAGAQLKADEIDVVVRTGGSSLIPLFQGMLEEKFGAGKVRAIDEFASVTAGLAVAAQLVSRDEIELPAYSKDILNQGAIVARAEQFERPVDVLASQLQEDEEYSVYASSSEYAVLEAESTRLPVAVIFISQKGHIKRSPLGLCLEHESAIEGIALEQDDRLAHLAVAGLDETLILVTNHFRLFAVDIKRLPMMGLAGAGRHLRNYIPLGRDERVTAICTLGGFDSCKQLNIMTAYGILYRIDAGDIETSTMGTRLYELDAPDFPAVVFPSDGASELFVVTSKGAAIRLLETATRPAGAIPIRPRQNGQIVGCLPVDDASAPILIGADGFAFRRSMQTFPLSDDSGKQIRQAVSRMSVCGVISGTEDDELILGSAQGHIVRTRVVDIPVAERPARGKQVAVVALDDALVHAAIIALQAT